MTDQDTTQQLPAPEPSPERPDDGGPKRLLRTRENRVIAGVAGGLGRYFNIDPVIVRIAFAISIFFAGLGPIAYVALALFVPTEPEGDGEPSPPPIERSRWLAVGVGIGLVVVALSWGVFDGGHFWGGGFFLHPGLFLGALVVGAILIARRGGGFRAGAAGTGDRAGRAGGVLLAILIAFLAFVGLSIAAVVAAWAGATGHGVAVALVVIGIGVMLVLGALNGGARWLIAPALALAIPLGAVTAADISFGDGIGEREYRPLSLASVPADGYELGIGQLIVDLRDLDWADDTVVELNLDLGVGDAVVGVPSNVCVTTDFDTRAGDLQVAGDEAGGVDVHSAANAGATATPRLDLSGEVDLGQLRVINDDASDLDPHHFHDGFNGGEANDDEMNAALDAACTAPPPSTEPPGAGVSPGGGGERDEPHADRGDGGAERG
jgi:phage shock protein PspC (stress-responsive transcriptional regulator)